MTFHAKQLAIDALLDRTTDTLGIPGVGIVLVGGLIGTSAAFLGQVTHCGLRRRRRGRDPATGRIRLRSGHS